jgi:DNA-binding XRE family transcriptional regulator
VIANKPDDVGHAGVVPSSTGAADRAWSRTTRLLAEALGRQVALARRRKRWTEQELATRARLSRSTVVKIERGKGNVALSAVLEVCWLLEVPLLGVTDAQGAEALLRRTEADLELVARRVRPPRKGGVPSSAF